MRRASRSVIPLKSRSSNILVFYSTAPLLIGPSIPAPVFLEWYTIMM